MWQYVLEIYTYIINIASFIYKQQQNLLPPVFNNYWRLTSNVHFHNIRQTNSKLFLEWKRTEQGKHMINYRGPTIWNHLPDSIINTDKLTTFKFKTKTFYLTQMKDTFTHKNELYNIFQILLYHLNLHNVIQTKYPIQIICRFIIYSHSI